MGWWKVKIRYGKRAVADLARVADSLERLVHLTSAARFTYSISLEELMPTYKADKPDFDWRVKISGKDSEANVIDDIPIPAGYTLNITSDNPAVFTADQDTADAKLIHSHVGGPNADGTPGQSNVVAQLVDPDGNLVRTGGSLVTVTAGDPSEIGDITLVLPE
jgi:hypothetical protein